MSAPVFLVAPGRLSAPGEVLLDGAEGRHAATVRRLTAGEPVELVDGVGTRGTGRVSRVGRAEITVAVEQVICEPEPRPWLVVAQAIPKGDRARSAIELLSEVGVDEVVPWTAQRCVARWEGDRGLVRWRAWAAEAGKQARRARHLVIAPPAGTAQLGTRLAAAGLGLVLHEAADRPLAGQAVTGSGEVLLVVGPEGGISSDELAQLAAPAVRLGPTVLRTGSAGGVAAALLLAASGRWSGAFAGATGPGDVPWTGHET